jgi:hypothetical protein
MSRPVSRVPVRERLRLANATRALAEAERTEFHRGRVLELGAVSRRVDLLDRVASLLEDTTREVTRDGADAVERLIAQIPRVRDYGPVAQERNEQIAAILAELGGEL